MPVERVTPRPRWVYSTSNMSESMCNVVELHLEKWFNALDPRQRDVQIPSGSLKRDWTPWMDQILDELPIKALEEIIGGYADLYIELEFPEEDVDEV